MSNPNRLGVRDGIRNYLITTGLTIIFAQPTRNQSLGSVGSDAAGKLSDIHRQISNRLHYRRSAPATLAIGISLGPEGAHRIDEGSFSRRDVTGDERGDDDGDRHEYHRRYVRRLCFVKLRLNQSTR